MSLNNIKSVSPNSKDSFGKKLMDRIRPTQPRFLHSTLRPPLPRCLKCLLKLHRRFASALSNVVRREANPREPC
ncbi:unnamed protein product [Eruca vesicaria subsp. sativa]|uniref:Uncharacterized protein n=1 Tax=Eruca vesicaria subsp. sativa TaxID=29727 RepID=A0ABC8J471_ERUVS|nr:unnamed protein product [Eruca vesicaria subsp. sativa]